MQFVIGSRRLPLSFLLASLVAPLTAATAAGRTIDTRFRQALFLPRSGQFIAQDAMNGAALYRLGDTGLVHSFRVKESVWRFAVTSDEKTLLMAGLGGNVSAHDLTTGQTLWELSGAQSGLGLVRDVSFSRDGR